MRVPSKCFFPSATVGTMEHGDMFMIRRVGGGVGQSDYLQARSVFDSMDVLDRETVD